jgi:hypothetical protein
MFHVTIPSVASAPIFWKISIQPMSLQSCRHMFSCVLVTSQTKVSEFFLLLTVLAIHHLFEPQTWIQTPKHNTQNSGWNGLLLEVAKTERWNEEVCYSPQSVHSRVQILQIWKIEQNAIRTLTWVSCYLGLVSSSVFCPFELDVAGWPVYLGHVYFHMWNKSLGLNGILITCTLREFSCV